MRKTRQPKSPIGARGHAGLPVALLVAAWGTAHAAPPPSSFSLLEETAGVRSGQDVALGDLNGDGYLDAFVVNTNGQPNKAYLNNTPTGPDLPPRPPQHRGGGLLL